MRRVLLEKAEILGDKDVRIVLNSEIHILDLTLNDTGRRILKDLQQTYECIIIDEISSEDIEMAIENMGTGISFIDAILIYVAQQEGLELITQDRRLQGAARIININVIEPHRYFVTYRSDTRVNINGKKMEKNVI